MLLYNLFLLIETFNRYFVVDIFEWRNVMAAAAWWHYYQRRGGVTGNNVGDDRLMVLTNDGNGVTAMAATC